jgi:hypothetical protein
MAAKELPYVYVFPCAFGKHVYIVNKSVARMLLCLPCGVLRAALADAIAISAAAVLAHAVVVAAAVVIVAVVVVVARFVGMIAARPAFMNSTVSSKGCVIKCLGVWCPSLRKGQ